MQRVAYRGLQQAAVHAVVSLGVADHRLDGLRGLAPQILQQVGRLLALLRQGVAVKRVTGEGLGAHRQALLVRDG